MYSQTTGGATGFNVGVQLYIALSFGFSLMVNVWVSHMRTLCRPTSLALIVLN